MPSWWWRSRQIRWRYFYPWTHVLRRSWPWAISVSISVSNWLEVISDVWIINKASIDNALSRLRLGSSSDSKRQEDWFFRYASLIWRFSRLRVTALPWRLLTTNAVCWDGLVLGLTRNRNWRCGWRSTVEEEKRDWKRSFPRRIAARGRRSRWPTSREDWLLWPFFIAHSELFTSFRTTAIDDVLPIWCEHALTETVFVGSFATAGLKCTLHETRSTLNYWTLKRTDTCVESWLLGNPKEIQTFFVVIEKNNKILRTLNAESSTNLLHSSPIPVYLGYEVFN